MSAEIRGLRQLEAKFRKLEQRTQGRVLAAATLAAAEPIRRNAASRVPTRTGRLAREIEKAYLERRVTNVTVGIGPSRRAFYGFFHEVGTRYHPARPFLRPAVDDARSETLRVFRERFAREVRSVGGSR